MHANRFYIFGIYVVMFTEILKTLLKVIFLFSILIIGFGLVFFILLGNDVRNVDRCIFSSFFFFTIHLLKRSRKRTTARMCRSYARP